jgi:hypothetical protein
MSRVEARKLREMGQPMRNGSSSVLSVWLLVGAGWLAAPGVHSLELGRSNAFALSATRLAANLGIKDVVTSFVSYETIAVDHLRVGWRITAVGAAPDIFRYFDALRGRHALCGLAQLKMHRDNQLAQHYSLSAVWHCYEKKL